LEVRTGLAPAQFGGSEVPHRSSASQSVLGGFEVPHRNGSPARYQQQQQQPQQQQVHLPVHPYADLPPEYKKAIDGLHERMMQHKRSMNNVQSMAPKALLSAVSTAQGAQQQQPPQPPLIKTQIASLDRTIVSLQQELQNLHGRAGKEKTACETSTKQAIMYGKWPVEAMAVRRGVRLHASSQHQGGRKKDGHAEPCCSINSWPTWIVSSMPSPYLWEIMTYEHRGFSGAASSHAGS
jgi:predicted RNA binding protein YcfA (HicA-like mRNA interferase family)